jgi:anthranilate phosphoribosyltransferase
MSNPASVKRQVIGVFDLAKARLMAEVLVKAGSEKVVTLHSAEGLDEVSCAGATTLFEVVQRSDASVEVKETTINPETFGFQPHDLQELKGSDASSNAKIIMEILNGEKGTRREAVIMNAAVGFYVAGKCSSVKEGRALAEESIDSKKAENALELLKKVSHS